eukprot:scaffold14159_cov115-Isochrysis_galbana.AAC.3
MVEERSTMSYAASEVRCAASASAPPEPKPASTSDWPSPPRRASAQSVGTASSRTSRTAADSSAGKATACEAEKALFGRDGAEAPMPDIWIRRMPTRIEPSASAGACLQLVHGVARHLGRLGRAHHLGVKRREDFRHAALQGRHSSALHRRQGAADERYEHKLDRD